LRQELRDAGRGELLAELCATWAQGLAISRDGVLALATDMRGIRLSRT